MKILHFDDNNKSFTTIEEKHIYQTDSSWISFNVSNTIRKILNTTTTKNTKINLKLILTIKSFLPVLDEKTGAFRLSLMPLVENVEHDYPVLLLFYKSDKRGNQIASKVEKMRIRLKRNTDEDYEEETNRIWDDGGAHKTYAKRIRRLRNVCRRKPLYIDFAEIHYDTWIVQPSGYEVSNG